MSDPTRWTLATLLGSILAWVTYRAGKWHSSSPNFPNPAVAGDWEAHVATAIAQAQVRANIAATETGVFHAILGDIKSDPNCEDLRRIMAYMADYPLPSRDEMTR